MNELPNDYQVVTGIIMSPTTGAIKTSTVGNLEVFSLSQLYCFIGHAEMIKQRLGEALRDKERVMQVLGEEFDDKDIKGKKDDDL